MVERCSNPRLKEYKDYGARGIFVCEKWKSSFVEFLADMGDRPAGMSLDRIDVNGPYTPENCRWATPSQQQRNRRNKREHTRDGITMAVADWADELGIPLASVNKRINDGWSIEKALTTPLMRRGNWKNRR